MTDEMVLENQLMNDSYNEQPELLELGSAEDLILGSDSCANDSCGCGQKCSCS